jgi:hypothetical protein
MTFYTDAAADALEVLAEFGQAMTLSIPGASTYDPTTRSATATDTSYPCTGVILDYTDKGAAGKRVEPGLVSQGVPGASLTERGDKYAFIAAADLAVTPTQGSKLTTAAGELWTVSNVKTLAPAGEAVMHEVQLRRS